MNSSVKNILLSKVVSSFKKTPSSCQKGHPNSRQITSNVNVKESISVTQKITSTLKNMINLGSQHNDRGLLLDDGGVKSFDSIPQPRSYPIFGAVLDYTPLGKFTPMEFDKALSHRHNE